MQGAFTRDPVWGRTQGSWRCYGVSPCIPDLQLVPCSLQGEGAPSWLLESSRVGGTFGERPGRGGQGWKLFPRPPRRGAQALAARPGKVR